MGILLVILVNKDITAKLELFINKSAKTVSTLTIQVILSAPLAHLTFTVITLSGLLVLSKQHV